MSHAGYNAQGHVAHVGYTPHTGYTHPLAEGLLYYAKDTGVFKWFANLTVK